MRRVARGFGLGDDQGCLPRADAGHKLLIRLPEFIGLGLGRLLVPLDFLDGRQRRQVGRDEGFAQQCVGTQPAIQFH